MILLLDTFVQPDENLNAACVSSTDLNVQFICVSPTFWARSKARREMRVEALPHARLVQDVTPAPSVADTSVEQLQLSELVIA